MGRRLGTWKGDMNEFIEGDRAVHTRKSAGRAGSKTDDLVYKEPFGLFGQNESACPFFRVHVDSEQRAHKDVNGISQYL